MKQRVKKCLIKIIVSSLLGAVILIFLFGNLERVYFVTTETS